MAKRRVPYFRLAKVQPKVEGEKTPPGLWYVPGVGVLVVGKNGETVVIHSGEPEWITHRFFAVGQGSDIRPWGGMRKIVLIERKQT